MARAGKLREQVTFQRQSNAGTLDVYGNPAVPTWSDVGTCWGDLRETPGKEAIAAGRLESPVTGTLRLRKIATTEAITAADRVVVRGHTWAIVGGPVDPEGRGRLLEFRLAREVAVQ